MNRLLYFLLLGTLVSTPVFALRVEHKAEVERFLRCVEFDYRSRVNVANGETMSVKQIEDIYAKPKAALANLLSSAQSNNSEFEKDIPPSCLRILTDLANELKKELPPTQ